MKFHINRPPKHLRRQNKINAQREWHKKFAWLPTSVDETTASHSRVWFERYWQKGEYGPALPGSRNPLRFTRISEREYFKKKLNGEFENHEEDNMMDTGSIDSVLVSSRTTSGPSGPISYGLERNDTK